MAFGSPYPGAFLSDTHGRDGAPVFRVGNTLVGNPNVVGPYMTDLVTDGPNGNPKSVCMGCGRAGHHHRDCDRTQAAERGALASFFSEPVDRCAFCKVQNPDHKPWKCNQHPGLQQQQQQQQPQGTTTVVYVAKGAVAAGGTLHIGTVAGGHASHMPPAPAVNNWQDDPARLERLAVRYAQYAQSAKSPEAVEFMRRVAAIENFCESNAGFGGVRRASDLSDDDAGDFGDVRRAAADDSRRRAADDSRRRAADDARRAAADDARRAGVAHEAKLMAHMAQMTRHIDAQAAEYAALVDRFEGQRLHHEQQLAQMQDVLSEHLTRGDDRVADALSPPTHPRMSHETAKAHDAL